MSVDLGKLILSLNPYTNRDIPYTDPLKKTGEMDPYSNVEADGPYRQEWTFKGEPQKVGMAYRLKYRYPVTDKNNTVLYYLEDYLLIGFEGSMGG